MRLLLFNYQSLPICRFCTMYFNIGLFPSKPTVQETLTDLGPTRSA